MAALVGLLTVVAAIALVVATAGHSRLDEVREAVRFSGCDEVRPSRDPAVARWTAAVETETDACENLGPLFTYARFPDEAALRSDLLRHPPSSAVCLIDDTEVLMTDLIHGGDVEACHRLHGVVVSRTEHVAPARGLSLDAIDRSGARFERQASVAMGHALRRHWDRHPLGGRPK
ncbi:hypothetical protein [Patulibacter minatonensis]|uniref:hypothetical protein n=1 Tax=Patulibacter minatonensis TaxID=298163 RepID=UPI0012F9ABD1|nr:hypothetical protein [Patulibacter minatonensis]